MASLFKEQSKLSANRDSRIPGTQEEFERWASGYGKLVQKELEAQRQLVDYDAGSLESFPPVVLPPSYGSQGGSGDNYRHDYHHKRYREDDRLTHEPSKRNADYDFNRNTNPDSRPEKNPLFRESGDSNEEEDHHKRRP